MQVDRLRILVDRLENKVNFDGIAEEEIDVSDDNTVSDVKGFYVKYPVLFSNC